MELDGTITEAAAKRERARIRRQRETRWVTQPCSRCGGACALVALFSETLDTDS